MNKYKITRKETILWEDIIIAKNEDKAIDKFEYTKGENPIILSTEDSVVEINKGKNEL